MGWMLKVCINIGGGWGLTEERILNVLKFAYILVVDGWGAHKRDDIEGHVSYLKDLPGSLAVV